MNEGPSIREVPAQLIHSIRGQVVPAALPAFIGSAFEQLYSHLGRVGAEPAGPPLAIYHAFSDDRIDAEIAVPVAVQVEEAGAATTRLLEAGSAAIVMHHGSYDDIERTHTMLMAWIAEHGRAPGGPVRERYLIGGDADTIPPAEYLTQVEQPLEPRPAPVAARA